MPQKQISVTIDIPEWANWVAQDYDSDIVFYEGSLEKKSLYWIHAVQGKTRMQSAGILFTRNAENWQNSKIDLRENDFEIINGELVAIPKMKDLPEMLKEQA